jgi:putative transposase
MRLLTREYAEHYHCERSHQGLDNRLLQQAAPPQRTATTVQRRDRLDGLLSFYHREAA